MLDLGALPFSVMSQKIGFFLFADDTNMFFSHDEVLLLEKTSDEEPLKLTSWWQVNKLSKKLFTIQIYGCQSQAEMVKPSY